jgi:hypothetical protein
MWRPWTEVDWDAPHPSLDAVTVSHSRIRFAPTTVNSEAAQLLVETFRSILTNGGAYIAAFTVEDVDDAGHWFLSRNRFEEYDFVRCLIASEGLAEAMPAVVAEGVDTDADFRFSNPLSLDGNIAAQLKWGGAYGSFDGSGAEAKKLGAGFSGDIIGDRYDDFRIDETSDGWSPWFHAVAWDHTWVITDKRSQRVTLLCITDTD